LIKLKQKKFTQDHLKNWLILNTTHALDLFTLFGGSCYDLRVSGLSKTYNGIVSDYSALMLFEKAIVGSFVSHWRSPGDWTVSFYANSYKIEVNLSKNEIRSFPEGLCTKYNIDSYQDDLYKEGVYLQDYSFLEDLATGAGFRRPLCTLQEAFETMKLAESIQSAYQKVTKTGNNESKCS